MKQLLTALLVVVLSSQGQAASRAPEPDQAILSGPSEIPVVGETPAQRYMGSLTVSTVPELEAYLDRVAQEFPATQSDRPVVLVLHGQEINSFIVDNYARYQSVVEKSTELTAKGYVQIEVCERWLDNNDVERYRLQPFVSTVRYGPSRLRDLRKHNYTYF